MMNTRDGIITAGLSFIAGVLVGGVAGVLLTPQSGPRTRRQIMNFADDVKERAGELAEDANDAVHRMVERGRGLSIG